MHAVVGACTTDRPYVSLSAPTFRCCVRNTPSDLTCNQIRSSSISDTEKTRQARMTGDWLRGGGGVGGMRGGGGL